MYLAIYHSGCYDDYQCMTIGLYDSEEKAIHALITHILSIQQIDVKDKELSKIVEEYPLKIKSYIPDSMIIKIDVNTTLQYDKSEYRSQAMCPNNGYFLEWKDVMQLINQNLYLT